jgi:hypothetical protein
VGDQIFEESALQSMVSLDNIHRGETIEIPLSDTSDMFFVLSGDVRVLRCETADIDDVSSSDNSEQPELLKPEK